MRIGAVNNCRDASDLSLCLTHTHTCTTLTPPPSVCFMVSGENHPVGDTDFKYDLKQRGYFVSLKSFYSTRISEIQIPGPRGC